MILAVMMPVESRIHAISISLFSASKAFLKSAMFSTSSVE